MCAEAFVLCLRRELRALLPPGSFLRRDRGAALFVTDALRRGFVPGEMPDYGFEERGELLFLSPSPQMLLRFERLCPPPESDFARSLYRFCGRAADETALRLFAEGLKLQEAADSRRLLILEKEIRQRAAYALRNRAAGGGLYAPALLLEQIKRNEVYTK